MSTNESSMSSRPVSVSENKSRALRDVRHVLWMQDDSGSDLDFVDFYVSADKSSTEGGERRMAVDPVTSSNIVNKRSDR